MKQAPLVGNFIGLNNEILIPQKELESQQQIKIRKLSLNNPFIQKSLKSIENHNLMNLNFIPNQPGFGISRKIATLSSDKNARQSLNNFYLSKEKSKRSNHVEPFQVFCLERRPELVKEHPNLSSSQITSILGSMWRSISPDIKQYYNCLSAKMALSFNQILNSKISRRNNDNFAFIVPKNNVSMKNPSNTMYSASEKNNINFDFNSPSIYYNFDTIKFSSLECTSKSQENYTGSSFTEIKSSNNEYKRQVPEDKPASPLLLHLFITPRSNFSLEISEVSQKCLY